MSTTRKTLEQIRREGGGYVDREKLDSLTEEEIERMAEEDGTGGEITEDVLKRARIVKPYFPERA
jgi:hypothetical protein